MSWFAAPKEVSSKVLARLPEALRRPRRSAWADSNRGGTAIDSFLEGPCLAADGALLVTDIPFGRIFRIGVGGAWQTLAEYDGRPNGMKVRPDGKLIVTDYKRGLLWIDPSDGRVEELLTTVNGEAFRGLNDLCLLPDGSTLFTDQGQTGMHDPSGRLYRLWPDRLAEGECGRRLDRLIGNAASPNGVAVSREGTHAFLALTRAAQIWRVPLDVRALSSKTQVFAQLPGGVSGPDGLVVDPLGRLVICDPGHGCAWVLSPLGVPLYRILSCAGRSLTNAVLRDDGRTLLMTESESGQILEAIIPG